MNSDVFPLRMNLALLARIRWNTMVNCLAMGSFAYKAQPHTERSGKILEVFDLEKPPIMNIGNKGNITGSR